MKICACCGAIATANDAVCSQCGEATWFAAPNTEPALEVVQVEPTRKRGR